MKPVASASWLQQGIHMCKFSWILDATPAGSRWILPTANLACTPAVWETVGPMDGGVWAGDALFCWRAKTAGFEIWFEPKARVDHIHPQGPGRFWRERFSRGAEFARARMSFERWSRWRAIVHMLLFPALVVLVLLRSAVDAWRCGMISVT